MPERDSPTALDRVVGALEDRGLMVRQRGDDYEAQCPAHHDESPSLSIKHDRGDGKVLLNCHTGCATADVVAALDLRWHDLFDQRRDSQQHDPARRPQIVATYPYTDASGEVVYQKLRMVPKDFRVRRPDGNGGWVYKIGDAPRVLYRLPEVLAAIDAGKPVLLVEGEKDADRAARDLGIAATCNYEGAAKDGQRPKWRREYTDQLAGAHVVIVADNDDAGFAHAHAVAHALRGVAQVEVFRPACDWPKADLSDHLDAGHSLDELVPVRGDSGEHEPPPPDLRAVDDLSEAEHLALRFERDVDARVRQLEIQNEAMRRLRAEHAVEPPPLQLLSDFLARDLGEAEFRITDLLPAGGRAMLSAQFKTGKSTMIGNLCRALADGSTFLEKFECRPAPGPVVLLDTELDERMLQEWFTRQGVEREDRVALVSLRGKVSSFDLTDPHTLTRWATRIAAIEPSVVILDCLRPVLDAIGLDEDKEAGRFLVAFDELLDRAGVGEAVVVHHMGHSGERSRGSSRLRDWPDVEWRLMRADPEDLASPRYFTAYGRDVDQPEQQLTFNPELRRLSVFGGSRRDGELQQIADDIAEELEVEPGLTTSKLEKRLGPRGHTRSNFRAALQRMVSTRQVATMPGRGTSVLHYLPGTVPPGAA